MTFIVRNAEQRDLPRIHEISEQVALGALDKKQAAQSGFLVSGFSLNAYERYLHAQQYFYVAESEGEIIGFLLAYESTAIAPEETLNTLLRTNLLDSFVLIKQICVAKGHAGRGVASRLYAHLFSQSDTPRFAAAVVLEPYNETSVVFHERKGFHKLCEIVPPEDKDGVLRRRGIWYCDRASNCPPAERWVPVERELDQTLMMEKQHAAIQLYNHEDNLNWTKFGMLITFMMALLAAADYVLKQPVSQTYQLLTVVVVVMGFSINFMFHQKLRSGLKFMDHHKHSVKELDDALMRMNPRLPKLLRNGDRQIHGKSVTSVWMRWVPNISILIWAACSVLLVANQFLSL